ncbi:MAG: Txe/YoeB family addiction module toxin [Rhizobiaceae bacterium]|nr:Txe/YoeB family addiction module toxin [Rhizobiaceae bacterium]
MKIHWTEQGWNDYLHWQAADAKIVERINELLREARRHPFTGLGKPEPLRNEMAGWWSRRITQEDRLIYRVTGKGEAQAIEIAGCRYHYGR